MQDWIFSAKNKPFRNTEATGQQLKERTVEELRAIFLEELNQPKSRIATARSEFFVVALGEEGTTTKDKSPSSKDEIPEEIESRH